MASFGGEEGLVGKKMKPAEADMPPGRREPRRGLGVAALESIRAQLETVGGIYVYPPLSTAPPPTPSVSLPASMLVPGVRVNSYVEDGAMLRDYYHHQYYYGPQHYGLPSRYLQQLQASNAHALPRHQNRQAGQQDTAIEMAAPLLEEKDHHRGEKPDGQMKPPVAFVDLVDSDDDDDDHSAKQGLDLELRL